MDRIGCANETFFLYGYFLKMMGRLSFVPYGMTMSIAYYNFEDLLIVAMCTLFEKHEEIPEKKEQKIPNLRALLSLIGLRKMISQKK